MQQIWACTLFLMSSSSAARMSARLPVTCSLMADRKASSVLPDISSVVTPPLHTDMLPQKVLLFVGRLRALMLPRGLQIMAWPRGGRDIMIHDRILSENDLSRGEGFKG